MPRENRLRWGLLLGLVLFGLMLSYGGVVCCEQAASCKQPAKQPCNQTAKQPAKSAPAATATKTSSSTDGNAAANDGIVFPPNQAVLLKGSFDVICRADEATLEVDGKPYEWDAYQPPVLAAHIRLAPGLHQLRIGKRQREFVVAMNEEEHDGPEDWPHHQFHPIESDEGCADCHDAEKKDGQLVVGKLKDYEACFVCHPSVEFEVIHSHPLEPIEHCQDCHALHSSSREGLLKAPVKKLCAECHDA